MKNYFLINFDSFQINFLKSMADIQARREARRRKILENAENRMRRINNLQRTPGKSRR